MQNRITWLRYSATSTVPFLFFPISNYSFFVLLLFYSLYCFDIFFSRTSEDSDGMDCLDSDEDDHVDRKPERYLFTDTDTDTDTCTVTETDIDTYIDRDTDSVRRVKLYFYVSNLILFCISRRRLRTTKEKEIAKAKPPQSPLKTKNTTLASSSTSVSSSSISCNSPLKKGDQTVSVIMLQPLCPFFSLYLFLSLLLSPLSHHFIIGSNTDSTFK